MASIESCRAQEHEAAAEGLGVAETGDVAAHPLLVFFFVLLIYQLPEAIRIRYPQDSLEKNGYDLSATIPFPEEQRGFVLHRHALDDGIAREAAAHPFRLLFRPCQRNPDLTFWFCLLGDDLPRIGREPKPKSLTGLERQICE